MRLVVFVAILTGSFMGCGGTAPLPDSMTAESQATATPKVSPTTERTSSSSLERFSKSDRKSMYWDFGDAMNQAMEEVKRTTVAPDYSRQSREEASRLWQIRSEKWMALEDKKHEALRKKFGLSREEMNELFREGGETGWPYPKESVWSD